MAPRRGLPAGTDGLVGLLAAAALAACTAPAGAPGGPAPPLPAGPELDLQVSVLQHHKDATRAGLYVDPRLDRAAARRMHRDRSFDAPVEGALYGQPLYLASPDGDDLVLVATELENVYAFDARTGAQRWRRTLGAPAPLGQLRCGIAPLGVTSTMVVDAATRTLYLDAVVTPDDGQSRRHLVFALSVDDGATRPGWPLDVGAAARFGATGFNAETQHQRGALLIVGRTLYLPYGAHPNDCGDYHGWVVGVPLDGGAPAAWATGARGGGIWGPGGLASDGTWVYAATGNTDGTESWAGGEAVLRFSAGPTFGGAGADYFAPADWKALDVADLDLGGCGPVLFDVPGAVPSRLTIALGKNGVAYLLDREDLGGIGGALDQRKVSGGAIIGAPAAYAGASGAYVVFPGTGASCPSGQYGNLTALRITATTPPRITTAWCADQRGGGSPSVTSPDGRRELVVWAVGAQGDDRLRAFDGETGEVLFDGGGEGDALPRVRRYQAPIAARGRIYVAAEDRVVAFTAD